MNSNPSAALLPSDALVLFGASGDLAHKKIFPALYAMCRSGALEVPVIGVASSPWDVAQFRAHAKDGIEAADPRFDPKVLDRLLGLLQYVSGDYGDPVTFARVLRRGRDGAQLVAVLEPHTEPDNGAAPLGGHHNGALAWPDRHCLRRDHDAAVAFVADVPQAEKACDPVVRGLPPEVVRSSNLDHRSLPHHRNRVAESERLARVVGHVNHRQLQPGEELAQVVEQAFTKRSIKRAERFVEE